MSESDQEATDLEVKAHKIVRAIVDKGPELTLEVHQQLETEAQKVALIWDIATGKTNPGELEWLRQASDGVTVVARIKRKRDGKWTWVVGTNRGENDNIHDAMRMADWQLETAGTVVIEGTKPVAGPWDVGVRRRADWAFSNTELCRVWAEDGQWWWTLTKMSGLGPLAEHRTARSVEEARAKVDAALLEAGWMLRD